MAASMTSTALHPDAELMVKNVALAYVKAMKDHDSDTVRQLTCRHPRATGPMNVALGGPVVRVQSVSRTSRGWTVRIAATDSTAGGSGSLWTVHIVRTPKTDSYVVCN